MTERPPYVVLGTVPFGGPWLAEQNLAEALGGLASVLYVEPPVTPLTPFRRRAARAQELRQLLRRRPRRVGRIQAVRPLALPPLENRHSRRLSAPLVAAQAKAVMRRLRIERPVVLAARGAPELRHALGESLFVFHLLDWTPDGAELLGRPRDELVAELDDMCRVSDLVTVISPALQRTLAERGFDSVVIRHGFHAELAPLYDEAEPPPEYAGLARPIAGYAGTIDGRLDFGLLERLADRLERGSVVLVGPVSPRLPQQALAGLRARSNVHLPGLKSREELPAYLVHWDCSLMPYAEGDWARHGSPLKLWDYLYAGPPIVAAGYEDMREFPPPLAHFAVGADGFADAVERALASPREGRDERRDLARSSSWDARAAELDALVVERLKDGIS